MARFMLSLNQESAVSMVTAPKTIVTPKHRALQLHCMLRSNPSDLVQRVQCFTTGHACSAPL
eukprot:6309856-Amphidinium_carterae.1